ncbi:major capsid protein [Nocardioides sp. GY 10127]|uniref:major capsid protein n=1 Tax=Nocardioides sp. GY 10127 TaxID=2569762 RepID=UPI0014580D61|nr:major capsid protein [Nocardioides sp. GY 10127]
MTTEIIYDDSRYPSPADVTTFIRRVPSNDTLQLLSDFPTDTSDTNRFDWSEITRVNRAAKYRSFDGRIHVSERDSGASSSVPLLPLSTSLPTGELERLQLEFHRNRGGNPDMLITATYNDAEQLTREVQSRLEVAWGDALTDGVMDVPELNTQADFGMPAEHKVIAATAWSDSTNGTPLTGIQAMVDVWTATNGTPPGRMKMSLTDRRSLLRSKEVIDAVHGSTAGHTRVTLTELSELLDGEGLPAIDPTYDTKVNVDGTDVRTIPEHTVVFLPTDLGELGATVYGVSATALELLQSGAVDMGFEDAAGIVGVVLKQGPPFRQHVFVDAVAQPVLHNARKLAVLTVG